MFNPVPPFLTNLNFSYIVWLMSDRSLFLDQISSKYNFFYKIRYNPEQCYTMPYKTTIQNTILQYHKKKHYTTIQCTTIQYQQICYATKQYRTIHITHTIQNTKYRSFVQSWDISLIFLKSFSSIFSTFQLILTIFLCFSYYWLF